MKWVPKRKALKTSNDPESFQPKEYETQTMDVNERQMNVK
jgi:hypothetical protein